MWYSVRTMMKDIIYKGCRFKIQKLETDYLVTMSKEKQTVDKFIIPSTDELFYYIDKYLNKFYSPTFGNTTRSYRSK